MGRKWADASGGTVKLRIYPGGVAGNEGDMVRKIGVGQLQAASLTTVGIHDITPEPQALDIPGLIGRPPSSTTCSRTCKGQLDAALAGQGLRGHELGQRRDGPLLLHLRDEGPQRPRNPARSGRGRATREPSAGWQAIGFQPVVLSSTDIVPSLQTGMINVVSEPPLYAFAARTFDKANHMLDLHWSLLTGATVVKKEPGTRSPPTSR